MQRVECREAGAQTTQLEEVVQEKVQGKIQERVQGEVQEKDQDKDQGKVKGLDLSCSNPSSTSPSPTWPSSHPDLEDIEKVAVDSDIDNDTLYIHNHEDLTPTSSSPPSPTPSHRPLTPSPTKSSSDPSSVTTYPEGGLHAYLTVLGSWCASLAALGTMNTLGSYQAHLSTHQLSSYPPSTIGWIFSLYACLAFAGGIIVGPVFDTYGAQWLVIIGSIGVCATMFLLGFCEEYWHFLLCFGLLGGASTSLLFTPSVAAVGHWFWRKRGTATGIAATGGAVGGIVFPLMLEALIPKLGFAVATRIIGCIYVVLCGVACLLIRTRLPPGKNANAKPDFRIFKQKAFAVTVVGVYLLEWALFVPLAYISSYALRQGFSTEFSFQVLVILNVGSVFGRWLPGYYADIVGRYNTMILTTILSVVSVLCIWLPAGSTKSGLVVFALLFGFASGSNISLTPVCIGQLCRTENYGRYYATCYTIVSVGCLTGIPVVGEIIASNDGNYWGLIIFVGVCYVGGLMSFVVVRIWQTGWKLKAVY